MAVRVDGRGCEREYLESLRRLVLGFVAAYLKLCPDSTLTLSVSIVERTPRETEPAATNGAAARQ